MHLRLKLLTLLLAASAWQVLPAALTRAEAPAADLYARAKAASSLVLIDDRAAGLAWWIDGKGTALTAAHVVGPPGTRIELQSSTLGRLATKVLAVDRGSDAALLSCQQREEPYPHVQLAPATPQPGADCYLFGAPLFRENVLLRGMIARDDLFYEFYGREKWYVGVIHVAAGVLPLTSGGVWMNSRGEAIGLQSGSLIVNGVPGAVAHMVPVEKLQPVVSSRQHARTPTLGVGVEELWQQGAAFLKPLPPRARGLVVKLMVEGSPLQAAGVKEGEVLLAVDDQPLEHVADLLNHIRTKAPGDKVRLTLLNLSGGENRQLEVPLGLLEEDWHAPGG